MAGSTDYLAPLQSEARQRFDDGQSAWQLDPESWKYTRISDFLPEARNRKTLESGRKALLPAQTEDFSDVDAEARANLLDAVNGLRHPLADLNLAHLDQGLLIHCSAGECKRVQLAFDDSGYRRLLLHLEAGSQLDLFEAIGTGADMHNLVVHVRLGQGATLKHRRLGARDGHSWTLIDAQVGSGASYDLAGVVFGPQRERIECQITLMDENASLTTRHLLLSQERERLDLQLGIDHRAARTQSRHLVKTLAGGHSQVTVRGRVHIAPECPQADAQLSIKSLLTSGAARINAKPELEIYTDDVACAHGTSISELDPEQLFYLASRGIAPHQARTLLLQAFAKECLLPEDQFNQGAIKRIEALAA